MVASGAQLYLFTIGILIAFVGLVAAIVWGRKDILDELKPAKINRKHLVIAFVIVLVFLTAELSFVQATQQLFFDDAIYQAMAQQFFHSGQAWFCDYGSPSACFIGEVFHEPIGTSFNFAIGFAIFGVNRATAYGVQLLLSCIAVLATFFVTLLLFRNVVAALFSELLMALSPILLVWAQPTTSDIPLLAYFLIAVLFMLVFKNRKNVKTFSMFAFSLALATYMKVEAIALVLMIVLMYVILDEKDIKGSLRHNARRIKKGLSDTRLLLVLLLFVLSVAPSAIFTYNQLTAGDFGYQGAYVQNSCTTGQSAIASSNYDLQNLEYNICANFYFWFNDYQSQYIMQPIIFTALAIIGACLMAFGKRRELLALGIWFLAFFFVYTAFYAGAVTYGVDWRFMLSVIAQASIFGGFACAMLVESAGSAYRKVKANIGKIAMAVVLLILITYSFYSVLPQLTVSPSNIPQAGNARFYENFVYNSSYLIPNNCTVFSYDPTLLNLVNKTSIQMSYAYNPTQVRQVQQSSASCLVADWGYWCYTPNNLCTNLNQSFILTPIATATDTQYGQKFGFYYMTMR